MSAFLAAVAGALVVAGLIGTVVALRPVDDGGELRPQRSVVPGLLTVRLQGLSPRMRAVLVAGIAVGFVAALFTGWVLAIVLIPAVLVGVPVLLSAPPSTESIDKLESLEEWTRSLSGKLTAGQSLRSALIRSLRSAPEPIEREVGLMVSRLWDNNTPTEDVLRALAEDLNDTTGDVVVANLILAASGRGQTGLASALDALAETVAADVRARRQILADQAKPRTTARTVTVITLGVLGALAFTGEYISPYGTPLGQVILAFLLALYAAVLVMMRRMAVAKPLPRFLDFEARMALRQQGRTP